MQWNIYNISMQRGLGSGESRGGADISQVWLNCSLHKTRKRCGVLWPGDRGEQEGCRYLCQGRLGVQSNRKLCVHASVVGGLPIS